MLQTGPPAGTSLPASARRGSLTSVRGRVGQCRNRGGRRCSSSVGLQGRLTRRLGAVGPAGGLVGTAGPAPAAAGAPSAVSGAGSGGHVSGLSRLAAFGVRVGRARLLWSARSLGGRHRRRRGIVCSRCGFGSRLPRGRARAAARTASAPARPCRPAGRSRVLGRIGRGARSGIRRRRRGRRIGGRTLAGRGAGCSLAAVGSRGCLAAARSPGSAFAERNGGSLALRGRGRRRFGCLGIALVRGGTGIRIGCLGLASPGPGRPGLGFLCGTGIGRAGAGIGRAVLGGGRLGLPGPGRSRFRLGWCG